VISRRVLVNLAMFVALFVALASWAVTNVVQLDQIEHPYTIVAEFESSPGLQPNVQATYLGVPVGSIEKVRLEDGHVSVDIDIDRGVRLPEGMTAAVRRRSAVGEPYIALDPPAEDDTPEVDPSSRYTIPVERTSVPLSYGELFESIDGLVAAVPGEDLGVVLDELATALEGRGPQLRQILASADDVTSTLATRTEMFDEMASDITALTSTLAAHRDGIGSGIDDLGLLTQTLAESSDEIATLLAEAPTFGQQVQELLVGTYDNLSCTFDSVGALFAQIGRPELIAELMLVLDNAGYARDGLDAALIETGEGGADGPYLGGTFGIVVEDPPPEYDPRPTFPEPPALAACNGPLAAADAAAQDAAAAAAVNGAGGLGEGRLDVPGRVRPGAPDHPATTDVETGSEAFPLATLLAAVGAALLVGFAVAMRPWRWLPGLGRSDSSDG
jgi:phospholipid/cholesterol/gamma-HCH transport system substrate-binding protein